MKRTLVALFLSTMLAFPAELPVKQVVLYKHGVGFFERAGRLGPGESARLDFKATEMNDVLKSLTVMEKGGGQDLRTALRFHGPAEPQARRSSRSRSASRSRSPACSISLRARASN